MTNPRADGNVAAKDQARTPMKSGPPMGSMIVVFRPGEHGPAKCSIWRWKE